MSYARYFGLIPFLLLVNTLFNFKSLSKESKVMFYVAGFFILLAMGKFFPFYRLLYYVPVLKSFRDPFKYAAISTFLLIILSSLDFKRNKYFIRSAWIFLGLSVIGYIVSYLSIFVFKDQIINIGKWYIENFVVNKGSHPFTLEYYNQVLVNILFPNLQSIFSLKNIMWIKFFGLFTAFLLIKKRNVLLVLTLVDLLITMNFFVPVTTWDKMFNKPNYNFDKNYRVYSYITAKSHYKQNNEMNSEEHLLAKQVYLLPNMFLLHDISSIMGFGSLKLKNYNEKKASIDGNLSAVVGKRFRVTDEQRMKMLISSLDTLSFMNVKYIISPTNLKASSLDLIYSDDFPVYIYDNQNVFPRVYLKNLNKSIDFKETGTTRTISKEFIEEDTLVLSENHYPGWEVYVNNEKKELLKVNDLYMGVKVKKGDNLIEFKFKNRAIYWGAFISIFSFLIYVIYLLTWFQMRH